MNRARLAVVSVVVGLVAATNAADDRHWENPVFDTSEKAIAAARELASSVDDASSRAERFFIELTLAEGDLDHRHPSSAITRRVIGDLLVTHPSAFVNDDAQSRTVDRFLDTVPKQQRVLKRRLERFGYSDLDGLVYLRLVDNVDAFASLNRASSDRMSRIGGVTYYCRYVVLPLSYVSRSNLDELRRSAIHNPTFDVAGTVRQWQNESFANLVNTFRHELVHVHTNSGLGVPRYSDRTAYPTWFHEGTATYLAADPHSGLSAGYQVYQDLFFYLVQRHGVERLQRFYGEVLGGRSVSSVLAEVYGLTGSDELFLRSTRWHRIKDLFKTGFWVAVLVIVAAAFRGPDAPYIGILQLLAAAALGLAVATGLAEHLYGLNGPAVVVGVKIGLAIAAAALATLGLRRIARHRGAVET